MFERDYLLQIIEDFCSGIALDLSEAFETQEPEALESAEQRIANLMSLDRQTALSLAPSSLVTMLSLSGVGDTLASYVHYALTCLAKVYEKKGDSAIAELRCDQAAAVAEYFSVDIARVPDEFKDFAEKYAQN